MKLITILFTLLVGVTAYCFEEISPVGSVSNYGIELMSELIMKSNIDNGMPTLDPYKFDYKSIRFSGLIYRIEANITNGIISGASNFDLNKFDFNDNKMLLELNISFPLLTLDSEHYEMDGDIWGAIPLAGRGIMYLEAHHTTIYGKIYFKQSENSKLILIDRVEEPQFNVGKFISRTQFDNNIDDIFNGIIDDVFAYYINRFNKYLGAFCIEAVVNFINSILVNFDNWRMIVL